MFPRLYAILDSDALARRRLRPLEVLDIWLDVGVRLVQLRAKRMPSGQMLALADDMAARCHRAGATFVVNDRADVARLSGADGVHVGQDDLDPDRLRQTWPQATVIGLSTHNEAQVRVACERPISYLAIGPIVATTSKDRPDPVVGLDGVRMAASYALPRKLPVVAIGGITLERVPDVLAAGASSVAIISDLLAGDVATRAREFLDAAE